jgi:hypothetical protein
MPLKNLGEGARAYLAALSAAQRRRAISPSCRVSDAPRLNGNAVSYLFFFAFDFDFFFEATLFTFFLAMWIFLRLGLSRLRKIHSSGYVAHIVDHDGGIVNNCRIVAREYFPAAIGRFARNFGTLTYPNTR